MRKKVKGHPRVITGRDLVILEYSMLHTKFQDHRLFGSGKEYIKRFLLRMDMPAILVM